MNWDALGAIGEIVGAAAVVVTLGYLAVQIRQNRADAQTNTELSLYHFFSQVNQLQATHPQLLDLMDQGMKDVRALDDSQRRQFTWLLAAYFYNFDAMYHQRRRSQLGGGTWPVIDSAMRGMLRAPSVQRWWETGFFNGSPEFRAYVDGILAESDHGEWDWVDIARAYDDVER